MNVDQEMVALNEVALLVQMSQENSNRRAKEQSTSCVKGGRSCSNGPRSQLRVFLGSSEAWLGGIGRSEAEGIESRWWVVSMLRHRAAAGSEPNLRDGSARDE